MSRLRQILYAKMSAFNIPLTSAVTRRKVTIVFRLCVFLSNAESVLMSLFRFKYCIFLLVISGCVAVWFSHVLISDRYSRLKGKYMMISLCV